jgi:NADPH:quinone reductase-like Zn-dependent oxidoreductase
MDLVRSVGADHVIDYTREELSDGTRRFDLIVDTGGRRPLSQLLRVLGSKGILIIVGGEGGDRWLGGFQRQMLGPLHTLFSGQKVLGLMPSERQKDLLTLTELIEAGKVTPVVDRIFPLSETADAIRYLEEGKARGKVAIRV